MEEKNYYQDILTIYTEMYTVFENMNVIPPKSQIFIDALNEFHETLQIEKKKIIQSITRDLKQKCSKKFINYLENDCSQNKRNTCFDYLPKMIFKALINKIKNNKKDEPKSFIFLMQGDKSDRKFFENYIQDILFINKLFHIEIYWDKTENQLVLNL